MAIWNMRGKLEAGAPARRLLGAASKRRERWVFNWVGNEEKGHNANVWPCGRDGGCGLALCHSSNAKGYCISISPISQKP